MRFILTSTVAALSLTAATLAHAGEGATPLPRQTQQQPYVNVPDDQDQQQPQGYDYPAEGQNSQVNIQNNYYQFNNQDGSEYLTPGYGGIPGNFQCNSCFVNYRPDWSEVIATGPEGTYRIWAGPTGPYNNILISAVNAIKQQTGMCQNLPFLNPVYVNNGPIIAPIIPGPIYGRPGYGYGPRPGYGYGRPGPGYGRPVPGYGRPGPGFGGPGVIGPRPFGPRR